MSVSNFIICEDCKRSLWIGQSGGYKITGGFYYGEEHTMKALQKFLYDHMEHLLRFVPEFYRDYLPWNREDGWKEIDAEKFRKKVKSK